jgi:hypothetical protein
MHLLMRGRSVDRVTGLTEHWEFDLAKLAVGVRGRKGFRGRPALAERVFRGFESLYRTGAKSSAESALSHLIWFWRFLDEQELLSRMMPAVQHVHIDDLDWHELEAIWRLFIDWLKASRSKSAYKVNFYVYSVFGAAHRQALKKAETPKDHLDIYIYFTESRSSAYGHVPLTFEEASRAFRLLAGCWRDILKAIEGGRRAASCGRDPMTGSSGRNRWEGGGWAAFENRLWLIHNDLPFGYLSHRPGKRATMMDGFKGFSLSAELTPLRPGARGFWGHVGACFLTWREIAVAFAMVCIKTGMSPDAIARMRVDKWYAEDPMHPGKRVIVFGPKRFPGATLRASSSKNRLTDAYQIILKVIHLTAPLRERAEEVARATGNKKLATAAKLIWIWPSAHGLVDMLPGRSNDEAHRFLDGFFERHGVRRDNGDPLNFRFHMGRHIWALFAYHRTGFNHVLVAQSLNHSNLKSLLHYLEQQIVRVNDRIRLIKLHGMVLSDLEAGRYDPRSYRETMPGQLSSKGVRCTSPRDPSPGADPGNPGGRICRMQKCWACFKWYATSECLPYLLRMIDDLESIRIEIGVILWKTSDYPEMLAVYQYIVSQFHPSLIENARKLASSIRPIVQTTRFLRPSSGNVG